MYRKIINNKIKLALSITVILVAGFAPMYGALASTFNNDLQDNPTFRISNYTKNPGCSTCWVSSVSADPGDIVSFDIYYHNTGGQTANNVTLKAILPLGSFTNANIPATITDHTGGGASGNVSLSLTQAQALTFIPGSVRWYPNQTLNAQALPSGQNGSEIVGSGLNIGSISLGWATQGHVVFRALVGSSVSQPQTSAPIVSTATATNISISSANLNATVNPNGTNTSVWFEYGTSPGFLFNMSSTQSVGGGNTSLNVSTWIQGLPSNTTYYFRAVAQNSTGTSYGNILSFTTFTNGFFGGGGAVVSGLAPIVTTSFASNISRDTATLNATVNPNGSFTNAWFEYGNSPSSMTLSSSIQSVGSGNFNYNISSNILNLLPNNTYYFRVAAQNSNSIAYGNTLSFTTSFASGTSVLGPNVTTLEATNVGLTSAILNAMVNPNNVSTDVWFEYNSSVDKVYRVTPVRSAGQSNYAIKVSAEVRDLLPNTLYDFRIVGKNLYGTNYGSQMSFVTSIGGMRIGGFPSVFTRPAYSVTSNSAILDASVNPNNSATNVWFEYGISVGLLGSKTTFRNAGIGNTYVDSPIIAQGLSPNTTYYYRPVAQNSAGVSYGVVNSFTTGGVRISAPLATDTPGSSQPIISLPPSSAVGDGVGLGASIFDALKSLSFSSWLILILLGALAIILVLLIKAKRIINLK